MIQGGKHGRAEPTAATTGTLGPREELSGDTGLQFKKSLRGFRIYFFNFFNLFGGVHAAKRVTVWFEYLYYFFIYCSNMKKN
jgi:hypothetical protein